MAEVSASHSCLLWTCELTLYTPIYHTSFQYRQFCLPTRRRCCFFVCSKITMQCCIDVSTGCEERVCVYVWVQWSMHDFHGSPCLCLLPSQLTTTLCVGPCVCTQCLTQAIDNKQRRLQNKFGRNWLASFLFRTWNYTGNLVWHCQPSCKVHSKWRELVSFPTSANRYNCYNIIGKKPK